MDKNVLQLPQEWDEKLTVDLLIAWLQGYALPPLGHDDEPYRWILRALPLGEHRPLAEEHLARHLASVFALLSAPVSLDVDRKKQLIYNGLMLAAGLSVPEILFGPLSALLQSNTTNGEWLGITLRDSLRLALTHNQVGGELRDEWFDLLFQFDDRCFTGTAYDAFDGIVMMPICDAFSAQQWIAAVGEALSEFARRLEETPDEARQRFRALLARAAEARLSPPSFERDLIMVAHECGWPVWAVECLPNLYVTVAANPSGDEFAFMWSRIAFLLPTGSGVRKNRTLCSGAILDVCLTPTAARYARRIASEIEPLRLENPYFSNSSTLGIVNEALLGLEVRAATEGEDEYLRLLNEKHRELLPELMGVG